MPGPQPDELLQAVPAAKLINSDRSRYGSAQSPSIEWMGRQWPIVAMPYLGALKSYLLVPSFAALGVNVVVLRATTLAFGAIAIALTFLFARRVYDWRVAALSVFLLATDPAFILMSRTDWGPIALGTLLRCLAALAILRWLARPGIWSSLVVGLCLGIAVYDKAHALAFVAALGLVRVLALILSHQIPRASEAFGVSAGFLVGSAPLWLWNNSAGWPILSAARGSPSIDSGGGAMVAAGLTQVPDRLVALLGLVQGGLLDDYIFGTRVEPWIGGLRSTLLAVVIVPMIILGIAHARGAREADQVRRTLLIAVTLLATVGIILESPIPVSVHHLIIVAPMLQILTAWLFVRAWDGANVLSRFTSAARAILAVSAGLLLVSNVGVYARYTDLMSAELGGPAWNPAIYGLAANVDRNYRDSVIEGMDWGVDMQLLFLTEGRAKVNPLWAIMGPRNENLEDKLRQSRYIFVIRAPGLEIDPVAAERFRDYLAATGRSACERRVINDDFGRPGYEILMFRGCR